LNVSSLGTWLADLCTQEGLPLVLGHVLSRKAIHGGNAKHEQIAAHPIAGLRRGGMRPQASVSPAEMRAPRDLRRRRMSLMHQRAVLLTPSQKTKSQYHVPALGKKIAYKANREGVAQRLPAAAVQKSIAVDRALRGSSDHLLTALELSRVNTAKEHQAPILSRRRSIPGVGQLLARVWRYELHDIQRFPRVQACAADGRLVKGAKESAGKR
jgi:hypothetical protein